MSARRLVLTTAAMALIGLALATLTPDLTAMTDSLAHAQRTADDLGPDALVLSAAGLLSWAVWSWGCLGLALTAASALPGAAGAVSGWAVRAVLPAGARRSAALMLGLGLGVAGPVLAVVAVPLASTASATVSDGAPAEVPDWPVAPSPGPRVGAPDWPDSPVASAGAHVVAPGDCLWDIALARLVDAHGSRPTDGEVARSVDDWWTTNRALIGDDPDLLLPGEHLEPPDAA